MRSISATICLAITAGANLRIMVSLAALHRKRNQFVKPDAQIPERGEGVWGEGGGEGGGVMSCCTTASYLPLLKASDLSVATWLSSCFRCFTEGAAHLKPSKVPLSSTASSPSMARGYPTPSSRKAVGPDQFVAMTAASAQLQ